MSVDERQLLIGELLDHETRLGERRRIKRDDVQSGQCIEKSQELGGAMWIVAAQEPAVAFGGNECQGHQPGRFGKQPAK